MEIYYYYYIIITLCKEILGVQKQTSNKGVLFELGRIPQDVFANKFAIQIWERIKEKHANDHIMMQI